MANQHIIRGSDLASVHSITRSRATGDGTDVITPDGRWDLIFVRQSDRTQVLLLSKPLLTAFPADHVDSQESLVITFNTGTFLKTGSSLDEGGFYQLPVMGSKKFLLGSQAFEIPTFDNAEGLIEKLQCAGILARDEVVESIAGGRSRAQSERTAQRHFRRITGMTPNYYSQIQRALDAMALLRQGERAIMVAQELGFHDQFHLSKSLKTILGQTPSQIASNK